jgi:hypothetical protein
LKQPGTVNFHLFSGGLESVHARLILAILLATGRTAGFITGPASTPLSPWEKAAVRLAAGKSHPETVK